MRHAVYAPTFNDYADPARLVDLAVTAEAAGYDGFFVWDHLAIATDGSIALVDATVVLGAIAQATSRLLLGAMVTPLARRRPWKVVKEVVTLDRLSGGRAVFGAGLGEPAESEFAAFGEADAAAVRAARLDEGLSLLDALLRGERVEHAGAHYRVRGVRLAPPPVTRPRPPIWIAATLPATAGLHRAARWDGLFPVQRPAAVDPARAPDWSQWWLSPAAFATVVERTRALGAARPDFAFAATGRVATADAASASRCLAAYRAAGANWWLEWLDEQPGSFAASRAAVARGPRA